MSKMVIKHQGIELREEYKHLLRDGKYLTFENVNDDYEFLAFFIYGNDYRKKELSEGSILVYKNDLRHFLDYLYSCNPSVSLRDLGYVELKGYQALVENLYAPATTRRKLQMVRSLLSFGFKVKFYPEDMSHYVRVPELKRTRQERKLTRNEMNQLFEVLKKNLMNRVIGCFLLTMGLRVSELCKAHWGDI